MTAVPRQPLMEARSDTHAMNALLNAVYLAVRIFERSDIRSWALFSAAFLLAASGSSVDKDARHRVRVSTIRERCF